MKSESVNLNEPIGPIEQELEKGHALLSLGYSTYAEVSTFKGKQYASIRRWFQADDGIWYRTKNGLNMYASEMLALLANAPELIAFIENEMTKKEDERTW